MKNIKKQYPAYYIQTLFTYIGKTFKGKYQIGYRFSEFLPTLYLNFKKKPKFYNAVLFNLTLFLPYILFLIGKLLSFALFGLIYLILMPFINLIDYRNKEAVMGVIWEIIAIVLFVILIIM